MIAHRPLAIDGIVADESAASVVEIECRCYAGEIVGTDALADATLTIPAGPRSAAA